jgi:L-fucose isomerase-like protein
MRRRMMLRPGRRYRRRRLLVGGATLLLVGGAAYKLGQNNVKKVEQHTGKPAEDLSQQELEQAMDDLGIEDEELTEADKAAIEAEAVDEGAPAGAPKAAAAAPKPAAPAAPDYITELERLAALRDKGILTPEEFDAKKKQLLGL